MQRIFFSALASLLCILASNSAFATNIEITVTEVGISGINQVVASWIQSENPTPLAYINNYYTTVPVWNAVGLGGDDAVTWYSALHLGGFTNANQDFNVLAPLSYSSDESAPSFLPGTYYGVDLSPDFTYVVAIYTITVLPSPLINKAFSQFSLAAPSPSVPEPLTWMMLLTGFGVVGVGMRRRNSSSPAYN